MELPVYRRYENSLHVASKDRIKNLACANFWSHRQFDKKYEQVASSVPKMLVGPKKRICLETSSHKCKGCQTNMPLNQSTLIPSIIDLTLD